MEEKALARAVESIAMAEALLIGAGAGMGVDSGLPDFRGSSGFWRAYPVYARLGLNFEEMANPAWFRQDPQMAWGFYGHRLNLYRSTIPHPGFQILQSWGERMPAGIFIFTSNVDGQFHQAGFKPEQIEEVHGAIEWLQCTRNCGIGIFPAGPEEIEVDLETMRATGPLPACPGCAALARPNILMFNDWDWDESRTRVQSQRRQTWLESLRQSRTRPVVIEIGAGTAVPTVRYFCEEIAQQSGGTLIRINLRQPAVPAGQIGLEAGALDALQKLDERLQKLK
ncbi:MAG TPA: Sir2 family NAD-dependent protein deacetylase [Chloroflexia bacterium]|nr:Sir2 family NAD-dependent protein deacetylase [Chloroflexia bacterium]